MIDADIIEYLPLFGTGIKTVLLLALSSLVFGMIGGIILALAKMSPFRVLQYLAFGFADFFRGIPEFLVLIVVFFAGPTILAQLTGQYIEITPFTAGVITLSIAFSCFSSETFRSAFLAISAGQIEAAQVYGLSPWQTMRLVKLPLMWRNAIPGLANIWQVLLKETAIVSVIGVSDVMRAAKAGGDASQQPFLFFLFAGAIYLIISLLSEIAQRRIENHFGQGADT